MGTILQFRQADTSKHSSVVPRSGMRSAGSTSAEIIIFPGVRIERKKEPGHPTEPVSGKRTGKTARRKI